MKKWTAKKVRPRWDHWTFSADLGADVPEKVLKRFDKPQSEFSIAFYEDMLAQNPDDVDTMKVLAELYTQNGYYRQGLEVDRRIVAVAPRDAVANYNLACSFALTHRLDDCFRCLRRAIQLGYRDFEHMAQDSDLAAAHDDSRWLELYGPVKT